MFGSFSFKNIVVISVSIFSLGLFSSCDSVTALTKVDRTSDYSRQDYRDALAPRDVDTEDDGGKGKESYGSIPSLRPYVAHTYAQRRSYPLVSVSVNRSVPLRDVFYQLAEQSEFDIELDPAIKGAIIFTARNRPLDQVVERICDMARLRCSLKDEILRVENDTPYSKIYKLDYLSFVRSNSSSIDASVSVVAGEGSDTGSAFSSTFESSSDFWSDLEDNLEGLLSRGAPQALTTKNEPAVTSIEPSGNGEGDAVVSIGSIPTDDDGTDTAENDEFAAQFSLNRQAGLISVYANQSMQNEIQEYLYKLKKSLTAQVLIEAKVMEVELSDEYAAGVDWSVVDSGVGGLDFDYLSSSGLGGALTSPATTYSPFPSGATQGSISPASSFVASLTGRDLSVLIRAISEFGTTKALASPRLVVLNNQTAVLNVARNRVFFIVTETEIEEDDNGDESTTVDYDTRTVPEGVIINVMPSIDLENRTISLAIRPSVTAIGNDLIQNPFVEAETFIPQVSIQEVDTVLNVKSGETAILGGLMRDTASATQDGVPVLSDIPVLGSLFRSHFDIVSKTELIIFLKATILDSASDSIHDTDRDLYRKFSGDRRPLKL